MAKKELHIETQLIHAENAPEKNRQATTLPIYQTSAFKYSSSQEISRVFKGEAAGHIYGRISNPTLETLERKFAVLENGLGAIVTASGMAAITATILTLAKAGHHIVASNSLFGGTFALFDKTIRELGVATTFVDPSETGQFAAAITDQTKAIFVETIGNPKMDVPDLAAIAAVAQKHGIPFIVDSTLTSPALIRPKDFGANIVVHSASKLIDGHGNALAGVLIDCGNFNWDGARFNHFKDYVKKYGQLAFLAKTRKEVFRDFGPCLSPHSAFLIDLGLETLALRLERQCANAQALAEYLRQQPKVKAVNYPGLADNKFHSLAKKQFNGKGGALFTWRLKDQNQCFKVLDSLKLAYNLANLGDAKTLVIHPASTIFVEFNETERLKAGVTDDLIRVSVGIEHIDDIIADFAQALEAV